MMDVWDCLYKRDWPGARRLFGAALLDTWGKLLREVLRLLRLMLLGFVFGLGGYFGLQAAWGISAQLVGGQWLMIDLSPVRVVELGKDE
ncbi:MAG: hypothetical protein LPH21_03220 [Shewanella sp.]|nr:hypothetical protein [Shewanella sp.]